MGAIHGRAAFPPSVDMPGLAHMRVLRRFDRATLERAAECIIALLDALDGDADREDGDEDRCEGFDDSVAFMANGGSTPGVGDDDDAEDDDPREASGWGKSSDRVGQLPRVRRRQASGHAAVRQAVRL
ncbi:hypothetical protein ACFSGX_07800 [Sphingomonas arantia]|uniref:Uncharacterized protein n=1 Tax=Sphingomonas arantia TaxID=1460676 RepID=A0ABW4TVU9_9SPHN